MANQHHVLRQLLLEYMMLIRHYSCKECTIAAILLLVQTTLICFTLSKVNKVQDMLISMWTNAVTFRLNVQNDFCRLQRRLSVACAIHWSRCQSLPGPDSSILPRHAGSALPRPWSGGACTHALVGSPTLRSRRGSYPDCSTATKRAEWKKIWEEEGIVFETQIQGGQNRTVFKTL